MGALRCGNRPGQTPTLLGDEITLCARNTFLLRGRLADLICVAGKRTSLAYLNHQLTAIEGVRDGVFLMPEEDAQSHAPSSVRGRTRSFSRCHPCRLEPAHRRRLRAARRFFLVDELPREPVRQAAARGSPKACDGDGGSD